MENVEHAQLKARAHRMYCGLSLQYIFTTVLQGPSSVLLPPGVSVNHAKTLSLQDILMGIGGAADSGNTNNNSTSNSAIGVSAANSQTAGESATISANNRSTLGAVGATGGANSAVPLSSSKCALHIFGAFRLLLVRVPCVQRVARHLVTA